MKHSLLLLLALVACMAVQAQQYAVYRVKGDAALVVRKNRTALSKGMAVTPKDVVSLAEGSELKLFDEQNHEMVTLRNRCAGSVQTLIGAQQGARQSMTQDYFAFILKSMTGQALDEGVQAGRTTAIFRDDADSLLMPSAAQPVFIPLLASTVALPVPVVQPAQPLPAARLGAVALQPLNIPLVAPYKRKKQR